MVPPATLRRQDVILLAHMTICHKTVICCWMLLAVQATGSPRVFSQSAGDVESLQTVLALSIMQASPRCCGGYAYYLCLLTAVPSLECTCQMVEESLMPRKCDQIRLRIGQHEFSQYCSTAYFALSILHFDIARRSLLRRDLQLCFVASQSQWHFRDRNWEHCFHDVQWQCLWLDKSGSHGWDTASAGAMGRHGGRGDSTRKPFLW